ncbi:MAG: stage V sporulation protein AD [Acutalibacteraceae bacterium]
MASRTGRYTLTLDSSPSIIGFASVVGKKEGEGPLAKFFDNVFPDDTLGEKTWEKAESSLVKSSLTLALQKAAVSSSDLDFIFGGDLLNQCIGSAYAVRDFSVPYIGLYGACSTMAEGLCLASLFVDTGSAKKAAAVTSSHFCSSERQFRYPLEYGGVRTPTSQWTVTGSGAAVVSASGDGPKVRQISFGKITDLGICDINNMGAAMAPAAAVTIKQFIDDTRSKPEDFDMILTGDLGHVGSKLLIELLKRDGIDISKNHADCGCLIFDGEAQDTHAGGSGCGCSASVLCSYILQNMAQKSLKNILFLATGALMSPTSFQQGESIPGIAHLLHITA